MVTHVLLSAEHAGQEGENGRKRHREPPFVFCRRFRRDNTARGEVNVGS
jgi:hypothetical protein